MFRKGLLAACCLPSPEPGAPHFVTLVLRTHQAHTAERGLGQSQFQPWLSISLPFPLYPIPELSEPISGLLGWERGAEMGEKVL